MRHSYHPETCGVTRTNLLTCDGHSDGHMQAIKERTPDHLAIRYEDSFPHKPGKGYGVD